MCYSYDMMITKTDYLEYTFCRKNLWLKKRKPELFEGVELSDFEKKIIEEGNLADEEARNLFPSGILIESKSFEAVAETKECLDKKEKVIFQGAFYKDDFFIRSDILIYDEKNNGYELYEVKASNDVKRKEPHHYINDLAFQKCLIESTGLKITKSKVIHLNRDYTRQGEIDYYKLFVICDVSDEVLEAQEKVRMDMEEMKEYLSGPEEKGCQCLYRGRSAHCTTFKYSNPQVPEYSVHDLNRIGLSKKLLTEWMDMGIYDIADILKPEKLKGAKRLQYEAYVKDEVIINKEGIKKLLDKLKFPLQFFDYEGFVGAIPAFNGFSAYEQIPFQYSLHILEEDGSLRHEEFLIENPKGDLTRPLADSMLRNINPKASTIAWYYSYEKQRNDKLSQLHTDLANFFAEMNENMFDLMSVFSNNYYVDSRFKGSSSIKNVLPIIAPELTYKNLNIRKGDQASERWQKMITPETNLEEKEEIKRDLLEYCKLDTYAMVVIYRFLKNLVE